MNHPARKVAWIYDHCKENGHVLHLIYQGNYNPITRSVIPELMPCLQHYNITFSAFNVVSRGLLTEKYKFEEEVLSEGGRFNLSSGLETCSSPAIGRLRQQKKLCCSSTQTIDTKQYSGPNVDTSNLKRYHLA
ncbi:Aflatoxin B1 aldehyde reductase member 2 [Dissophora globulifera]|nr:Aflatoxin B1 aldehyde reductase member 2 [Dissophora globulifera]